MPFLAYDPLLLRRAVYAASSDAVDSVPSSKKRKKGKETLVVLGTGFGALSFLRNIDLDRYDVTVVSPRNYFLFTPLLSRVSVGLARLDQAMMPLWRFLGIDKWRRIRYVRGHCVDIDPVKQTVALVTHEQTVHGDATPPATGTVLMSRRSTPTSASMRSFAYHNNEILSDEEEIKAQVEVHGDGVLFEKKYDKLVIAVGSNCTASASPTGHDRDYTPSQGMMEQRRAINRFTHRYRTAEDAESIRKHVLDLFERAARPTTSLHEIERLLRVVVVGGDPASLELAIKLQTFMDELKHTQYAPLIDDVKIRNHAVVKQFEADLLAKETELRLRSATDASASSSPEPHRKLKSAVAKQKVKDLEQDLKTRKDDLGQVILMNVSSSYDRNSYDSRIVAALQSRFKRRLKDKSAPKSDDGTVEVWDVSQVTHVEDGRMSVMEHVHVNEEAEAEPTTNQLSSSSSSSALQEDSVEFGLCVWAAGREPLPLIQALKRKIRNVYETTAGRATDKDDDATTTHVQDNTVALVTDDFLRVLHTTSNDVKKGIVKTAHVPNVYALGDCATIEHARFIDSVLDLFQELDENNDDELSKEEFSNLVKEYQYEFPQLKAWESRTAELFDLADVNGDGSLCAKEFKTLLEKVSMDMTRMPTTAQTAVQQGRYLGKMLNDDTFFLSTRRGAEDISQGRYAKTERGMLPFRYKHWGGFEYVGYDNTITRRGTQAQQVIDDFGAFWLWRSIYTNAVVPTRMVLPVILLCFLTLGDQTP